MLEVHLLADGQLSRFNLSAAGGGGRNPGLMARSYHLMLRW
jgi:hypothetical protein